MQQSRTELSERPRRISTQTWILASVGMVAALLFLAGVAADLRWLRLAVKPIPVLCMALWVALMPDKGRYQVAVLIGLLLGAAGDVLLELGESTFIFGLVAFLLGHLAYIIAFLQDSRKLYLGRAAAAYLFGVVVYIILLRAGQLGDLAVPVALYVVVICTMLWRGASRWGQPGVSAASARAGLIGSVLFVISDTILALNIFVAPIPLGRFLNISTYWLGQLGIAVSARKDREDS